MNIQEAMLVYAPSLAEDYKKYARKTFDEAVEKFGATLKGIHKDKMWHRIYAEMRPYLTITHPLEGTRYSQEWWDDSKHSIDDDKLNSIAKKYGEDTALNWFGKMKSKLGELSEVSVSDPRGGGEVTIVGKHGTDKVEIFQHTIINRTMYGEPFHQFPARIYVNGKFYSENDYKKLTRGWGMPVAEKAVTEYQCNACGHKGRMGEFKNGGHMLSCPKCRRVSVSKVPGTGPQKRKMIDPETRPKQFYFTFKTHIPAQFGNPEKTLDERDSAKGMTADEALNKLIRQEERFHSMHAASTRPESFGYEIDTVYAWNGKPIWKKKDGTPCPYKITANTTTGAKITEVTAVKSEKKEQAKEVYRAGNVTISEVSSKNFPNPKNHLNPLRGLRNSPMFGKLRPMPREHDLGAGVFQGKRSRHIR